MALSPTLKILLCSLSVLFLTPVYSSENPMLISDEIQKQKSTDNQSLQAAQDLIKRVLPQYASSFTCEIIPDEQGLDVFEIEGKGDKIILRGNSGLSIATAFNWYLKYHALASYDWQAVKPLSLTKKPIAPIEKMRRVCQAKERFFLNYCTYGYSFPYADDAEWQRFFDWMAMNGINRPLVIGGQEAVWLNVWKSYGLTEGEVLQYFTAPAHLAWHRMANIDQWGGPLPKQYVDEQSQIQKKRLNQARILGMKPILSGFAGHVPGLLKQKFPEAKMTAIKPWGGFKKEHTWFLDPTDPLFNDIQKRFIEEQTRLYGTDHHYAADPFNEIDPPSWAPDYMKSVAKSITEGMQSGDKDAVWYQMGWAFGYDKRWLKKQSDGRTPLEGLVSGVTPGKLIFLDYVCEEYELYKTTNNFGNSPFIWNYLANFGGCTYQLAPLNNIAAKLKSALKTPLCTGVGSTLEGFSTYPIAYEFTLEAPWLTENEFSTKGWLESYAQRRTGQHDPAVIAGWNLLADKVLNKMTIGHYDRGNEATKRPRLDKKIDPSLPKTALEGITPPRNPEFLNAMIATARLWLKATPDSQASDAYQYDLVNLTRQILSFELDNTIAQLQNAYKSRDKEAFTLQGDRLLNLMSDLDTLVGTRHEFLVGAWLKKARDFSNDLTLKDYYERNARQIITTWGAPGAGLTDYARRDWNGLIKDYYRPRWVEFIRLVKESLDSKQPIDAGKFQKWCINHEGQWSQSVQTSPSPQSNASAPASPESATTPTSPISPTNYPATPQGNPLELVPAILSKYFPEK